MAKKADDSVLDGSLNIIATGVELYVCTSEPTDRANAIATSLIPAATPAFTGPAAGGGGRQLTIDANNGNVASGTGTANHVALCTGALLLEVTTCPDQAITNGNTVNIAAYTRTIPQPT